MIRSCRKPAASLAMFSKDVFGKLECGKLGGWIVALGMPAGQYLGQTAGWNIAWTEFSDGAGRSDYLRITKWKVLYSMGPLSEVNV